MVPEALEVAATTLALVLFVQAAAVVVRLAIAHRPLDPPEAPCVLKADCPSASPGLRSTVSVCEMSATQLAIAKAVHPHLHDGLHPQQQLLTPQSEQQPEQQQSPRPEPGKDRTPPAQSSCRQCTTMCNGPIYRSTVPYCSVWLATAHTALGAAVAVAALVWQLAGPSDCRTQAEVVLFGFHIGLALLLWGSAVQTHMANARCIKIFFIMCCGLAAHFTMYGLALDRGAVVSVPAPTVCVTTIGGDGWLARLPMYTGIAHLAMFFFSLISFINGAVRLCPHNSFLVPRELLCVLLVYRGLGTMFATALTGILFGALTVLLTTLGLFRPIPCWLVMWAVVARVMAAALWHRTYTDPVAPVHSLWTSPEFRALYASRQLLQFSTAAGSEPPAGWPNRVPAPCLVALISAAIAPQKPLPLPPLAPVPDSPRSSAETIPKAGYKRTTASGPYAATTSPHETVVDVATRLSGH